MMGRTSVERRRVVVTGMGMVTCLGLNVSDTWQAVCEGRSGIGPIDTYDPSDLPVRIAGLVKGFDITDFWTEKDAKRLFPEELWNKLHLQIIFYGREYSPARGWNLENDIITKTIGRKSVLDAYYK